MRHETMRGVCTALLTVSGTITEYGPLDAHIRLPWDEYNTLAERDRWMAHATLPAIVYFDQARRRLEHQIILPVPSASGTIGAIAWYFRAICPSEEYEVLHSSDDADGDYEVDERDESSDSGNSLTSDGEQYTNNTSNLQVTPSELADLVAEHSGLLVPPPPPPDTQFHDQRTPRVHPRTDEPVFGPPGVTRLPEVGVCMVTCC